MKSKMLKWFSLMLLTLILLVGCSSNNTDENQSQEPPSQKETDDNTAPASNSETDKLTEDDLLQNPEEPVTIRIFQQYAGLSDKDFTTLMKEPIEERFPNITLELVRAGNNTMPEELILQGEFPDFIFTSSQNIADFRRLDLLYDHNEMFKKYNMSTDRYVPEAINDIQNYSENNELYAIPFSLNFGLLFYNKDIFDEVAVSHPKDFMTWEEIYDLANQIGNKSNGKYHSLIPTSITRMSISWMLRKVDEQTMRANFSTDDWKELYQLYRDIHLIPGNIEYGNEGNRFYKDLDTAMIVTYGGFLGYLEQAHREGQDSSFWDFTTFPQRKNGPEGLETEVRILMLSPTSKNKDIAFQVMNYLTSKEVQTIVSRNAQRSALAEEEIKNLFGADFESLKDKNVDAIFKQKYNVNPIPTIYDNAIKPPLFNAFKRTILEGEDVNTALKRAEEEANQIIDAMKQEQQ